MIYKAKKQYSIADRRRIILYRLKSDGEVLTYELARYFGVTPITIRRDLDVLAKCNALIRTSGGAIYSMQTESEFAFLKHLRDSAKEKRRIAQEAVKLIEPGMSIIIGSSNTTLEVARALTAFEKRLQVITPSMGVAILLHTRPNIDVIMLGGNVGPHWSDVSGGLTTDYLRDFHVQMAILSADALNEKGLYTTNMGYAHVHRAIMDVADCTVVVADSGKLRRNSFVKYADWTHVRHFITDSAAMNGNHLWLNELETEVRFVEAEPEYSIS